MSSLKRILAGVDGSESAEQALRFAIERAKRHGATLGLAYTVNRTSVAIATSNPYGYVDPTPMLDAIDEEADTVLESGVSLAKTFDVEANGMKLEGLPADAIVERAKETRADLVVVGTHGRRGIGRVLIGSVAEGVIRTCTTPVFVVPQHVATAGSLNRAVVCIDGSPASELALLFAARIAEIENTRLTLCTVVEPESLTGEFDRARFLHEEMETKARETLVRARERVKTVAAVESQLLHGDAVAEISSFAQRTSADCIFAGTHGRAGIPRMILGSVASGLLQSSRVPVCTVRHR
jgi:nucleotide-binding universal stress UspA family protein